MERIRLFERNCLRICLRMYNSPSSNYKKSYSNKIIYDKANIHRIDIFILKLIRDHFANSTHIRQNSLIYSALYPNPSYYRNTLNTGFISPEAFPYLDSNDYISDINNIPIIYHATRHKNKKQITYTPRTNCLINADGLRYKHGTLEQRSN